MSSTTLVVVANGDAYIRYADQLFESARTLFHPTNEVDFLLLEGHEGWPAATMYRWHVLLDDLPKTDYIYLCDADMRFEGEVGPEILPENDFLTSFVATLHPGYVDRSHLELPYEDRKESACYVKPIEGDRYFCGGFAGGPRASVVWIGQKIRQVIDQDMREGITPRWHDESALNRILAHFPPELVLDPSYCYPDTDTWYQTFWTTRYQRKLVAIDKTKEERGDRPH